MEEKILLDIGLETLVNPDVVRFSEFHFISPYFGFVNSPAKIESNLITVDQPYRTKEGRITAIKQGYARALINLIEETFQPDKLSVIVPNSILQIVEVSPGSGMQTVGIGAELLSIAGKDNFFTHPSQLQKNLILSLTSHECDSSKSYFALIWNMLQKSTFRRETIRYLLASLLCNIKYLVKNNDQREQSCQTYQEETFQRLISLANAYSRKERNISFYVDKLCLTPRYLNTITRQASQ